MGRDWGVNWESIAGIRGVIGGVFLVVVDMKPVQHNASAKPDMLTVIDAQHTHAALPSIVITGL
jgi:hypothetical protein